MQEDLSSRRAEYRNARNNIANEQIKISLLDKPTDESKQFYKIITDRNDKKIELLDSEIKEIIAIQDFPFTLYSKIYEVKYDPILISGSATELPDITFKLFKDDVEEKNITVYIEDFCGLYLTFIYDEDKYIMSDMKGEFVSPVHDESIRIITGGERGDGTIICPRCENEILETATLCTFNPTNRILVIDPAEDFLLTEGVDGMIEKNGVKITYRGSLNSSSKYFIIQKEDEGITFNTPIYAIGVELFYNDNPLQILYQMGPFNGIERPNNCSYEEIFPGDYNCILPGSSYVCLIPGYGDYSAIKRIVLAY